MSKEYNIKAIQDTHGNEFILLNPPKEKIISYDIEDCVSFESFYNHCHILDNIKNKNLSQVIEKAKSCGQSFYQILKRDFPKKKFLIFATISDSLIIRFHQKWSGETPYCNPDDFQNSNEIVIMFDTDKEIDDFVISRM